MFRLRTMTGMGVLFLAVGAGCRTDALFESRQRVDAPMTSLAHPEGVQVPELMVTNAQEVDLVEQVLAHRAAYYQALQTLRGYYHEHGYYRKEEWAAFELADVERIKPFKYIMDAEIPRADLHATDTIPEADARYDRGRELMRRGGHQVPMLYREDLMKQALKVFVELITQYPSSDKIDDAAFQCGEIYKEYFKDQEEIALQWYERAWTWNPHTPHPARFQAAVVCDYRLHDRARALELYQQVLQHESGNKSNVAHAVKRIHDLSRDLHPRSVTPVSTQKPSTAAPSFR